MKTVTCTNLECQNYDQPIEIDWDGTTVICGPCGEVLEEQADWYEPEPAPEPPPPTPSDMLALLGSMTPEDRQALIGLLSGNGES